jgi:hypothetical protein
MLINQEILTYFIDQHSSLALDLFECASERYTQNNRDHSIRRDTLRRMNQQDVINLSKAGMSDSRIMNMMDATDTWFQLKPQEVIDLRNAAVGSNSKSKYYSIYPNSLAIVAKHERVNGPVPVQEKKFVFFYSPI